MDFHDFSMFDGWEIERPHPKVMSTHKWQRWMQYPQRPINLTEHIRSGDSSTLSQADLDHELLAPEHRVANELLHADRELPLRHGERGRNRNGRALEHDAAMQSN